MLTDVLRVGIGVNSENRGAEPGPVGYRTGSPQQILKESWRPAIGWREMVRSEMCRVPIATLCCDRMANEFWNLSASESAPWR